MTIKLAYNVNEAVAATGLSRDTLLKAIGRGALVARKSGLTEDGEPAGRWVILAADLQAWLENLEAA